MADQYVQLQPDSTGKKVDTTELTVGANTVERQRIHIAGTVDVALVEPVNAVPANSAYAVPMRSTKNALTPSAPAAVSVGVASGAALAANANRKGATFINTSTATISFGLAATAVLNSGITLAPNGVWVMDEFTFTVGAINAIAGSAASNLAVQEFA